MREILPYYHEFARPHPRVYGIMYFIWNAPAGGGEIGLGLQQFMDPDSPDFDAGIRDHVIAFGNEVRTKARRSA
jgi:hypothetical protein